MENVLYLRKCAYIFDSTHTTYRFGTKAEIEKQRGIEKEIKRYYDEPGLLKKPVHYTMDDNENYYIMVNGFKHRLNDIQIAKIDRENEVINHRRIINRDDIKTEYFKPFCNNSLHSKKYKSFYFEFFTSCDTLGYIRVNFKGNHARFIIDNRTGDLYTSGEHGKHQRTSAEKIRQSINITSDTAKKEFYEIITYITEVLKND